MDTLENWLDFRKGEMVTPSRTVCHDCRRPCSGDVTDEAGHVICDDPENCPANKPE